MILDKNKGIIPLHALAIQDNPTKCPLHRTPLITHYQTYWIGKKKLFK